MTDSLSRTHANRHNDSEVLNPLPLTFQKRNSDAPLLRFLPEEGDGTRSMQTSRTLAQRVVSADETESLVHGCERLGTSLEHLFLTGYACLLSRLTRQEMVLIQLASAGLIEYKIEGEISFRTVTGQIHGHSIGEVEQDPLASFDSPTQAGKKEDLSSSQSVAFEFTAKNSPADEILNCGLRLNVKDQGLVVELTSLSGKWEPTTLAAWLDLLLHLLRDGCTNPDKAVKQLLLMDETEALALYEKLNQTAVEYTGEASVPERIQVQIKRRAEATAIVSGLVRCTYRELDQRSQELARQLVTLGAGPNRAVAVCMERSVSLPIALLAILRAGAYYVPLDPHNPSQRLRGIIEECVPVAIISDMKVARILERTLESTESEATQIPMIVADGAQSKSEFAAELPTEIDPESLAYTIYTSGTTGKPKGVQISHGALLNLICSMWQKPGVTDTDRTLAVAPISFDIATMDMFLPLCSGGTLVLASREDAVDPYQLVKLIKEHEITCMQATPATWKMLVSSGWSGKRNLKMISGGEALPRELANSLIALGGELWNCYGPTETTIYSGVIRIFAGTGIVPVGPPISNTSFYVLDSAGNLVPPGVAGELCIGGVGVSPGYVARPELTQERFIPDRFGAEAGGFLFRTGDLVRIVHGNQFEFFGRLDHQVKLRGFRIELGEIESVLRTHPAINDAVVVLREDIPGEPRLVAYVVSGSGPVGAAAIREFASQLLPEYMLPSVVILVDQFPLSASGKINRRALPVPESVPRQIAEDHPEAEGAKDALEEKLLTIFREVLRNDQIGVTDSFFRYGGYSLLTVRLFSRIDRELHARLPISMLFDAPTVRDLARVIHRGIAPSVIVPIRPYGRWAPIFIVQSYLLYSAMLEIVESDRPVYGVRELGDEREPLSVEERARKFSLEIVAVHPTGPLYLAGWCAAGTLTVEIARQLRETGRDVALVALFDAERPGFTLPKGLNSSVSRLWKKAVFHLGKIQRIPWTDRVMYISEALGRNWDWAVESYYTANYRSMLWLQKRLGLSLSEAAFNNVYASLSALKDFSVRPYPGKLNLFRAADVPNFSEIDASLGWSAIALGGVEVNFVPGDHVSMFKKPNVTSLAQHLQQELQRSEGTLVSN